MYALTSDIVLVDTEYGMVLLDQIRGDYWSLNPSGVLVLRTVLRTGEPDDAVAAVMGEFSVDRPTAEADVRGLVAELTAAGILLAGDRAAGQA